MNLSLFTDPRVRLASKTTKQPTVSQLATEVAKLRKQVNSAKGKMHVEERYILQRDQLLAPASRTSASLLLNPILRGNTVQSRMGDRISATHLHIRGTIGWTQSGATQNQLTYRMMVLRDNESNGAAPLFNAVTPATGYMFIGAQGNLNTYPLPNFNNTDLSRYQVLFDKTDIIRQGVTNSAANCVLTTPIEIKISLGNVVASYVRGNAGDITDIDKGAVYIYFWNDSGSFAFTFDAAYYFNDF